MRGWCTWLTIALTLTAAGCDMAAIKGSGKVTTDKRTVSGFSSVTLEGTGKLVIDQNGSESLTIEADDNLLPLLTSEVRNGQLVLGVQKNESISPSRDIVYTVSAVALKGITLAGSGSVEAAGVKTDVLEMSINGSGDMRVEGTADQQKIAINGSGGFQGGALKGRAVTISIAGSGDAVVAASDTLDVTIAGSGSIEYLGDPKITRQILGAGSVQKR